MRVRHRRSSHLACARAVGAFGSRSREYRLRRREEGSVAGLGRHTGDGLRKVDREACRRAIDRRRARGACGIASRPRASRRERGQIAGPQDSRAPAEGARRRSSRAGSIATSWRRRTLRGEAVSLLEIFVKEDRPRPARCPRRCMRLGELYWELEREQFVDALSRRGRRSPSISAAPRPSRTSSRSRDLFARVLKDYKWFESVRPGALRRRLPRLPSRASPTRRSIASTASSTEYPDEPVRPRRAHGARRGARSTASTTTPERSSNTRRSCKYPAIAISTASRCSRARGASGASAAATKRPSAFVSVFEVTDAPRRGHRREAQAARRAPGRSAEVPRRGLHRRREEHRARRLRLPRRSGRRPLRRQDREGARGAFYDQAHYERGIEAYELLLKLEPTGPDAPE